MDDLERLLDHQFRLDLYSDMQLADADDAANFEEMVDYWDTAINQGIVDCIHRMNRGGY